MSSPFRTRTSAGTVAISAAEDDNVTALALVDSRHAALDRQRVRINASLDAIDAAQRQSADLETGRRDRAVVVRIKEAAEAAGVRASAVRFWEKQGLLNPSREGSTGFRSYNTHQLNRLIVIALLRDVGYRFDAIREVLDEFASGRPERLRRALDERLERLHQTTWQCLRATSALYGYMSERAEELGRPEIRSTRT